MSAQPAYRYFKMVMDTWGWYEVWIDANNTIVQTASGANPGRGGPAAGSFALTTDNTVLRFNTQGYYVDTSPFVDSPGTSRPIYYNAWGWYNDALNHCVTEYRYALN